jgi:serine protease
MKKALLTTTIICILFSISCKKTETDYPEAQQNGGDVLSQKPGPSGVPQGEPMTAAEIDKQINRFMDSKKDFRWQWVNLPTVWSAIVQSDHSVAVGYKPSGYGDISPVIHSINLKDAEWKSVHDAIIDHVVTELNRNSNTRVSLRDIIIEDDETLPIITFRLTDRNIITWLYNLENVRYIEPLGYWPQDSRYHDNDRSSSGCDGSSEPLNSDDWTVIPPNCRLPWNFNNLNIPEAWTIAQGQGIKIGVIDGGISSSQPLLGSLFKNGYSNVTGRTISIDYTYGSSAYTTCTHGTSMSAMAAGPRNDQGTSTGIAYKSSLYFIHGCEDVVLDESAELSAVKNALTKMGKKQDLRIISMSIGTPFSSSVLLDGVNFAYNKGKLLFAAAGTSFGWTSWWGVIYPANYTACNAITGVKEDGSTCSVCHDGSKVIFTVPMERNVNDSRNSLSLALSGNSPTYIGGSSVATATAAGIAALVWSAKPTLTPAQVITCMRNTAQYYPGSTSNHGYGNLNANAAVSMALTY